MEEPFVDNDDESVNGNDDESVNGDDDDSPIMRWTAKARFSDKPRLLGTPQLNENILPHRRISSFREEKIWNYLRLLLN